MSNTGANKPQNIILINIKKLSGSTYITKQTKLRDGQVSYGYSRNKHTGFVEGTLSWTIDLIWYENLLEPSTQILVSNNNSAQYEHRVANWSM